MEFQGDMAPSAVSTIEVSDPPVEDEEYSATEKVKTLKVADLKVELKRRALSKNSNKAVLSNRIL